MAGSARAFVLRHTAFRPVPGLEQIRLHRADDALALWHAVQVETGDPAAPLPYWAFAWGGGLAIGRYLAEHPEVVRGQRVFDLASGSGLCAIAAIRAGAADATAADIDPFASAAIGLNARANRARITVVARDVLDEEPPDVDVILAGDAWYEAVLAERVPEEHRQPGGRRVHFRVVQVRQLAAAPRRAPALRQQRAAPRVLCELAVLDAAAAIRAVQLKAHRSPGVVASCGGMATGSIS